MPAGDFLFATIMNKTFSEFIVRDNGLIQRRTVSEEDLVATDDFIAKLTSQVATKILRVAELPTGEIIHLSIDSQPTRWITIDLKYMDLNAPFRPVEDNTVVVPVFSSTIDPVMTIRWTPPTDMKLKLLVQCNPFRDGVSLTMGYVWLLAFGPEGACWRLPLSNVYEDGKVCMGNDRILGTSIAAIALAAIQSFRSSRWNNDLWTTPDESISMFRFKPNAKEFEQLPPKDGSWKGLCRKIAPGVLSYVVS